MFFKALTVVLFVIRSSSMSRLNSCSIAEISSTLSIELSFRSYASFEFGFILFGLIFFILEITEYSLSFFVVIFS